MGLSNDLISKFVEITNDTTEVKQETTVYGTIVAYENDKYVKIDGSDLLTPISSTTDVEDGERVTVMIKNHAAIVTGNISSPSARTGTVQEIGNRITEAEILIADKVSTKYFDTQVARIDELTTDNVSIKERLTASEASIGDLETDNVTINETLTAHEASIDSLNTTKLSVNDADIKYATIENLNSTNAEIHNIEADYGNFVDLTTNNFSAVNGDIANLQTTKLSTTDAAITYANIDFSNIGKAAIEEFFAKSGLIENVIVGDGIVTGKLVGVTIKGDLIEGGTVVADKLVIQGTDGLYYKLNTNGVTTESEQTEYNSLDGSIITAKSITATKINVSDLVAFDATIGGFKITDDSIYSGVKENIGNTTRGIYMDNDGQIAFGDASNYIKFYKDTDGVYKLTISAQNITLGSENKNVEEAIGEVKNLANTTNSTISTLITGQNGESLMTQTDTGWTFSLKPVLDVLNSSANGLINHGKYIQFGVDNGQPCIILGGTDSDFKVVITNTDIRFMEGSNIPASISNHILTVDTTFINSELRQGGFSWSVRNNGNYGLVWKGE